MRRVWIDSPRSLYQGRAKVERDWALRGPVVVQHPMTKHETEKQEEEEKERERDRCTEKAPAAVGKTIVKKGRLMK